MLMYFGRKACLIVVKKDPWGNDVLGFLVIKGVFDFSSHRREASRIQHLPQSTDITADNLVPIVEQLSPLGCLAVNEELGCNICFLSIDKHSIGGGQF